MAQTSKYQGVLYIVRVKSSSKLLLGQALVRPIIRMRSTVKSVLLLPWDVTKTQNELEIKTHKQTE